MVHSPILWTSEEGALGRMRVDKALDMIAQGSFPIEALGCLTLIFECGKAVWAAMRDADT